MQIRDVFKTKDSRMNFLAGLIRMSKADGIVDESEKIFFSNAALSLELDEENIKLLDSYWSRDDIHILFETKVEALYFFQQAIQLCNLDGEYSGDERIEIQKLRQELNVSEESIEKIEKWVNDGIKWAKDGEALLYIEK